MRFNRTGIFKMQKPMPHKRAISWIEVFLWAIAIADRRTEFAPRALK